MAVEALGSACWERRALGLLLVDDARPNSVMKPLSRLFSVNSIVGLGWTTYFGGSSWTKESSRTSMFAFLYSEA